MPFGVYSDHKSFCNPFLSFTLEGGGKKTRMPYNLMKIPSPTRNKIEIIWKQFVDVMGVKI